jgi:tetraprenyl-beta-curcumene synthase
VEFVRDAAAVGAALGRYWLAILPWARREIDRWRQVAERIPNPVLREQALSTLREEGLNSEGAVVFATLVPRANRGPAIRAMVAFEVMYDYLDTLSEQRVDEPLGNGLQLHRALSAALDPDPPDIDYYEHCPHSDDGGYLQGLIAACRQNLALLPAFPTVLPALRQAAVRCGEGQSYTHAAIYEGTEGLAAWAQAQDRAAGYEWWELAAGAISSVCVFALMAAAADAETTAADAAAIDAAYFPPLCALSALLDSLIDHAYDTDAVSHSNIAQYDDNLLAAGRLAAIAAQADGESRRLRRRGRRHAAIAAGIAAFYLSAPEAETPFARPIRDGVTSRLGPMVPPIMATMRLRRHLRGNPYRDGMPLGLETKPQAAAREPK